MAINPGKSMKEIAQQFAGDTKTKLDKFLSPDEVRKFVDIDIEENRCFSC